MQQKGTDWHRLGEPVDLLDRKSTTQLIGTDHFHGGLLDHRAGTINPMSYCRGLARAATGAGATMTTGVKATALRPEKTHWLVDTSISLVMANKVVPGTNAYTDTLWPGLNKIFTTIYYFRLATQKLDNCASHILPGKLRSVGYRKNNV